MFKLPLFSRAKLLLAFEYGLILSETAKAQNIELTADIVKKAEIMLENEFRIQSASHLATNTIPNLLTAFELDISK